MASHWFQKIQPDACRSCETPCLRFLSQKSTPAWRNVGLIALHHWSSARSRCPEGPKFQIYFGSATYARFTLIEYESYSCLRLWLLGPQFGPNKDKGSPFVAPPLQPLQDYEFLPKWLMDEEWEARQSGLELLNHLDSTSKYITCKKRHRHLKRSGWQDDAALEALRSK